MSPQTLSRIIPCRISSKTDYNDFAPTLYTDQRVINDVIKTLTSNGKNLSMPWHPIRWTGSKKCAPKS